MVLMSENRISRSLRRMAFEIMEIAGDHPIILVGLNVRGRAVADILFGMIEKEHSSGVDFFGMNADDAGVFEEADAKITGSVVFFVDDVIFSGHTLHRALRRMEPLERAENVRVATLVDRGHRKLPVQADVVGMHAPTKLNEHIELVLEDGRPHEIVLQV